MNPKTRCEYSRDFPPLIHRSSFIIHCFWKARFPKEARFFVFRRSRRLKSGLWDVSRRLSACADKSEIQVRRNCASFGKMA